MTREPKMAVGSIGMKKFINQERDMLGSLQKASFENTNLGS